MLQGSNLTEQSIARNTKAAMGPIRGLSRSQAAAYIGISASSFDDLVKSGLFPKPVRIKSRTIWDIRQLDEAFDDLGDLDSNPWDGIQ